MLLLLLLAEREHALLDCATNIEGESRQTGSTQSVSSEPSSEHSTIHMGTARLAHSPAVKGGAMDGARLPDTVAAVQRLRLLAWLAEGLEQDDPPRDRERQSGSLRVNGGGRARMKSKQ